MYRRAALTGIKGLMLCPDLFRYRKQSACSYRLDTNSSGGGTRTGTREFKVFQLEAEFLVSSAKVQGWGKSKHARWYIGCFWTDKHEQFSRQIQANDTNWTFFGLSDHTGGEKSSRNHDQNIFSFNPPVCFSAHFCISVLLFNEITKTFLKRKKKKKKGNNAFVCFVRVQCSVCSPETISQWQRGQLIRRRCECWCSPHTAVFFKLVSRQRVETIGGTGFMSSVLLNRQTLRLTYTSEPVCLLEQDVGVGQSRRNIFW